MIGILKMVTSAMKLAPRATFWNAAFANEYAYAVLDPNLPLNLLYCSIIFQPISKSISSPGFLAFSSRYEI